MGRGDSTKDGSAAGRSIDPNISHLPEDGGTGRCGRSRQSLNPSCYQGPRRLSGDTDSRLLDAKEEQRKVLRFWGYLSSLDRTTVASCPASSAFSGVFKGVRSATPGLRNCCNPRRPDFLFSSPCLLDMGGLRPGEGTQFAHRGGRWWTLCGAPAVEGGAMCTSGVTAGSKRCFQAGGKHLCSFLIVRPWAVCFTFQSPRVLTYKTEIMNRRL